MTANAVVTSVSAVVTSVSAVEAYLRGLQQSIVAQLEHFEAVANNPVKLLQDAWQKPAGSPLQGEGLTCMLENGAIFERAGVGFSKVSGKALPPSATQKRPELAGASFDAMGVSLVFHPRNPYVPTVHMNVRMLAAQPANGAAAVVWFGGGMDLTPYYPFTEDCVHFHQSCKTALAAINPALYAPFKAHCDEYFFLKHRNEARGIGGIFFDDFLGEAPNQGFELIQAVGNAFNGAYFPIAEERLNTPYGERQRSFQALRRARYVEFNLVFDRGTHFGLQSGGRTESILLSMPPNANWAYQFEPEAGSEEARLYTDFLPPRAWV